MGGFSAAIPVTVQATWQPCYTIWCNLQCHLKWMVSEAWLVYICAIQDQAVVVIVQIVTQLWIIKCKQSLKENYRATFFWVDLYGPVYAGRAAEETAPNNTVKIFPASLEAEQTMPNPWPVHPSSQRSLSDQQYVFANFLMERAGLWDYQCHTLVITNSLTP